MKTSLLRLHVFMALSFFANADFALGQGTAFTYQGRLNNNGSPLSGGAEFQPTLWSAESNGTQIAGNFPAQIIVEVTNGLFTLPLDFGTNFPGADRWLQLEVRTAIGPFTLLAPRQKLTPTPYAITANNLNGSLPAAQISGFLSSSQLAGTYTSALTLSNAANLFTGSGAGLTSLSASQLTSGTVPNARLAGNIARTNEVWLLSGNTDTKAGIDFLGTADNQPLELKVNNVRAFRLEPTTNTASRSNMVNVIGGSPVNFVAPGVYAATIAGGGTANYGGFGSSPNSVGSDFGTVGGGDHNVIQTTAPYSTISGGSQNQIQTNASTSTIGGGSENRINAQGAAFGGGLSTIGGGINNTIGVTNFGAGATLFEGGHVIGGGNGNRIGENFAYSTIAGGLGNNIQTSSASIGGGENNFVQSGGFDSVIGGGQNNTNSGSWAVIPGGDRNVAAGANSFAAGHRAKANHQGAFVWGDSNNSDIVSTNTNSVTLRAAGGYRLFSNSGATAGAFLAPGGTSWSAISDRAAKKNFQPVQGGEILEKLSKIPVQKWNYKWESDNDVPHIGPMAQDFKAAFYPGRDDKSITTQEIDGVALAAIQGLNQKLEKQRDENAELKQRLSQLEELVSNLASGKK